MGRRVARMERRAGMISGRVTGPVGEPVGGARVYVADAPAPMPDVAILTDAGGGFALDAPAPGRYRIACAAEHYRPASESVDVPAGGGAVMQIRLER